MYIARTVFEQKGSMPVSQVIEGALNNLTHHQISSFIPSAKKLPINAKKQKLMLSAQTSLKIDSLTKEFDASVEEVLFAAHLAAAESNPVNTENELDKWLETSGRTIRDGQLQFYSDLRESMNEKKVGLCEAATGTGKTVSILAAMADTIKGTGKKGVIATPTVTLVKDFAAEHAQMGENMPELKVFFGAREFVSELELIEFLGAWNGPVTELEAARDWLEHHGISHVTGVSQSFLKHSLSVIAPSLPVEEVLLHSDIEDDDLGVIAYRSQFMKSEESFDQEQILICTHAMLATDIRARLVAARKEGKEELNYISTEISESFSALKNVENSGEKEKYKQAVGDVFALIDERNAILAEQGRGYGRLPDYHFVITDEAHLLENSFSSSLSSFVAIRQMLSYAKKLAASKILTKACSTALEGAYHKLVTAAKEQNAETISVNSQNDAIFGSLLQIATEARNGIKAVKTTRIKALSATELRALNVFKSDLSIIELALKSASSRGNLSYIELSPRLSYPRLFTGKVDVSAFLQYLWASVDGAACTSATLYMPRGDEVSAYYSAMLLSIPVSKKLEFAPVVPAWIKETISEIHFAADDPEKAIKFTPAKSKDKNEVKEEKDAVWSKNVAEEIASIYEKSAGGCLVLMTSYASVDAVRQYLEPLLHTKDVLVCARQAVSLKDESDTKTSTLTIDQQRRQFLQIAHLGEKAIWLALGSAWTGINISGGQPLHDAVGVEVPAHLDNVLTDLIIPKLPFRLNKSITHAYRMNNKSSLQNWEGTDTLLRLRQGRGRLVRRQGVPKNRKIWVLDGRLANERVGGMTSAMVRKAMM